MGRRLTFFIMGILISSILQDHIMISSSYNTNNYGDNNISYYYHEQPIIVNGHSLEYPNDDNVQYYYNWGDGTFTDWSYGKIAAHTYDKTGLYLVNVTIKYSDNSTYYKEIQVTIHSGGYPPHPRSLFDQLFPMDHMCWIFIITIIILFLLVCLNIAIIVDKYIHR